MACFTKFSIWLLVSFFSCHILNACLLYNSTKAVEELKVEQILRQSPVRKVGEVGEPANFGTNYIKLKCKNQGVYQYVVHFDPPIDNQMSRIKLLYHASEITGSVRLFDGHTLFLPILLKEKVTVIKAKAREDTKEVTMRIQLTKILPPQQIPPTVFNIIFKKYFIDLKENRLRKSKDFISGKKPRRKLLRRNVIYYIY